MDKYSCQSSADSELLRDLSLLLERSRQDGTQITGNIEVAAVRMQAVKELFRSIESLTNRKATILEKISPEVANLRQNICRYQALMRSDEEMWRQCYPGIQFKESDFYRTNRYQLEECQAKIASLEGGKVIKEIDQEIQRMRNQLDRLLEI